MPYLRPTDATVRKFERSLNRGGKLNASDFEVEYSLQPADSRSIADAAALVSVIQSCRTVIPAAGLESDLDRLEWAGEPVRIEGNSVTWRFPFDLIPASDGIAYLMTILTSGIEYGYTEGFWLSRLSLPESYVRSFGGPRLGVSGIRDRLNIRDRPILGVVLKPCRGNLSDCLVHYHAALLGGVDIIVDDLLMSNTRPWSYKERIPKVLNLCKDVGRRYVINLGYSLRSAMEIIDFLDGIRSRDGTITWAFVGGFLINPFYMGIDAITEIKQRIDSLSESIPIFASNMGSGTATRQVGVVSKIEKLGKSLDTSGVPKLGFSEEVLALLCRISGADAIHAGTMEAECSGSHTLAPATRSLASDLHGCLASMAVAEGDVTIANLWPNMRFLTADSILEPTTGILNFPGGPELGARSFLKLMSTLDCDMSNEEAGRVINNIRKKAPEIQAGLEYYGYKPFTS